jgi:Ca2+:H+ antiporter
MIGRMPWWTWVWPLLAWCVLLAVSAAEMRGAVAVAGEAVVLVATVFAAVWHAEVVAHRVGEPFGTLVLALAVTVIEVALIVSVMLAGKAGSETLARDTAFAAVMLILNGLVGLSLLMGGVLHHEQEFQVKGASAALAVLAALVTLSLVLPNFTTSVVGPAFSPSQLAFAGTASLVLYGVFIFVQAVRHRDYFLPDPKTGTATDEEAHAAPPSAGVALASLALLLISLVAIVSLTISTNFLAANSVNQCRVARSLFVSDSAGADQCQRAHDMGKRGGTVSTMAPIDTERLLSRFGTSWTVDGGVGVMGTPVVLHTAGGPIPEPC